MKLDSLSLHPETRRQLEAYARTPPHALLVVGAQGIGKYTVAEAWALAVLDGDGAGVTTVTPDDRGTISIEAIRELYKLTRHKNQQLIVIVDHAEAMSGEAQNAFLKLLEEPRAVLQFVLTAPHKSALLPTILSRTQQVLIRPQSDGELQRQWQIPTADAAQLLFIAEGRPGTVARLVADHEAFAAAKATMQRAKELLAAKRYDQLAAINSLAGNREACIGILEAMQRMAALQLKRALSQQQTEHWLQVVESLEGVLTHLAHNANLKLQLLKLFAGSGDLL